MYYTLTGIFATPKFPIAGEAIYYSLSTTFVYDFNELTLGFGFALRSPAGLGFYLDYIGSSLYSFFTTPREGDVWLRRAESFLEELN